MYKLKNEQNEYLNSLFSTFTEFDRASYNLINAKTLKDFHTALNKCVRIDRRCTFLFLKKYREKIPKDYIYFAECIIDENIYENGEKRLNIKWTKIN